MSEMDDTHREFIALYNSADLSNVESFKTTVIKLIHHTKHHFEEEEKFMDKYNYPRVREHKEEHEKVLAEMAYFLQISRSVFGLKMLKSYYLQKLPEWFELHLLSMDSDLAAYLKDKIKITAN